MKSLEENFYDLCRNNEVFEAMLLMNRCGIKDYNGGFIGFCKAGNLLLVDYMILKSNWKVDLDYGLRVASSKGYKEIVEHLLYYGAKDVKGAFEHACKKKQTHICAFLKYYSKMQNVQQNPVRGIVKNVA